MPARGSTLNVLARSGVALTLSFAVVFCSACSGSLEESGSQGGEETEEETLATGNAISRVKPYGSLEEISADSDLVVLGTVESQECVYDIDDVTAFVVAEVQIAEVIDGEAEEGATIEVRQTATLEESMLEDGETYLFYLVESGLDGDLADQYYVTGSTAGIYISVDDLARSADDSAGFYERVDLDSGDDLPETVKAEEVLEAL